MSKEIERQINLLSFFLCHRFLVPWTRIMDEFYGGVENEVMKAQLGQDE